MRLMIVGSLNGQLGAATKIALDRGAKVVNAPGVQQAMSFDGAALSQPGP